MPIKYIEWRKGTFTKANVNSRPCRFTFVGPDKQRISRGFRRLLKTNDRTSDKRRIETAKAPVAYVSPKLGKKNVPLPPAEQPTARKAFVKTLRGSDVVYLTTSSKDQIRDILGILRGSPVLTVSDSKRFLERGGMIELYRRKGKVKIGLNLKSTKAAKLTVQRSLFKMLGRKIGEEDGR